MKKSIILSEHIADFIMSLDTKEVTKKIYARHLNEFLKWYITNCDVDHPTRADIIRYKQYLYDEKYSWYGATARLMAVKYFFRWLGDKDLFKDIAAGIHGRSKELNPALSINVGITLLALALIKRVKKLGWQVALPAGGGPKDDGMVHGMIIGESSYVEYVLKHLD